MFIELSAMATQSCTFPKLFKIRFVTINSKLKIISLTYILFEANRTGNKVDNPFRGARGIFVKAMEITTIRSARNNVISHKL